MSRARALDTPSGPIQNPSLVCGELPVDEDRSLWTISIRRWSGCCRRTGARATRRSPGGSGWPRLRFASASSGYFGRVWFASACERTPSRLDTGRTPSSRSRSTRLASSVPPKRWPSSRRSSSSASPPAASTSLPRRCSGRASTCTSHDEASDAGSGRPAHGDQQHRSHPEAGMSQSACPQRRPGRPSRSAESRWPLSPPALRRDRSVVIVGADPRRCDRRGAGDGDGDGTRR
jgi:hypothetical protein